MTNRPLCASRADIARWQQRAPAERLASQHYWRARRLNGGKPNGFWPGAWWERMCREADWRCTYCGRRTSDLSPDHVRPLAKHGSNEWRNIVPACPECQLKKGARPFTTLLPLTDFLVAYFQLHPDQRRVYEAICDVDGEPDRDASGSEHEEAA